MKKGDAVYKLAQPIARFLDFMLGTDIEHCDGCKRRRILLNEQTIWQLIHRFWYRHNPFKK